MRVAVIGAGIAGLTAAHMLRPIHQVTLYERESRAGGHANTIDVCEGARSLALDTGFIVYNEHTYPGFTRLLSELGVATRPSDMSFSVSCRACRLEYSSAGLRGLLAQPWSALRPQTHALLLDLLRFYGDAARALRTGEADGCSLSQWARDRRYSGSVWRHFLAPLGAAVWSTRPADIGQFPARYYLRFLHNHGIIGIRERLPWRTVEGGSRTYVNRIVERLDDVRLAAPVRLIFRGPERVEVIADDGCRDTFDAVILACHADQALALLGDADERERDALSRFRYTRNEAILHTDPGVLPQRLAAQASWNYVTMDCRRPTAPLAMSYHLNRLQGLEARRHYSVTVNDSTGIRAERVIARMSYDHPLYTFGTVDGQRRVRELQGHRRTYYAGAHLGYGFHEDGWRSGAEAAQALGANP